MGIRSLKSASISTGAKRSKFWDQSAVYAPATFYSIATATVDSSGASSITFTGIPSTYKHLQIRWSGMDSRSVAPYSMVRLQVGNGSTDTGANYSWHYMSADPRPYISIGGAGSQTFAYVSDITGNGYSGTANYTSSGIIDIYDYASTAKNKTFKSLGGANRGSGGAQTSIRGNVGMFTGAWYNTAAITNITITCDDPNFTPNTKFALYGVK